MENASKALIMAAEVLIAMVILSLAVYLVITFGNVSAEVHQKNEEVELLQFNTQFTQFEAMKTVTIYDVVTVANYARENNQRYEVSNDTNRNNKGGTYYVSVDIKTSTNTVAIENKKQSDLDELIKADIRDMQTISTNHLPKYKCETLTSSITGRIYKVIFSK